MKKMKFWMVGMVAMVLQSGAILAQKIDDERMTRDIEVAENVLSTLVRNEISGNSGNRFWGGMDIKGTYQEGHGVTFRLPDYALPMVYSVGGNAVVWGPDNSAISITKRAREEEIATKSDEEKTQMKLREAATAKKRASADSTRDEFNKRFIKAAKDFIVDYGDFISQLGPNEKIIVTNQGENRWVGQFYNSPKRVHISVEGTKADIVAVKQGKMTRDQAIGKLKVINTESVDVKEAEFEILSSIIGRLYREDLSKTYYSNEYIGYERLKDFGVIFYMPVYSSSQGDMGVYSMPTVKLSGINQEERNKKVVELYPKFEAELKDNILEYARSLKTLKDDEAVVFNVTLTKCKGCGIPSTLELSVKNGVLKDYAAGKLDKSSALARFSVKKGANQ